MKFLALKEPVIYGNPTYRGTERIDPYYVSSLDIEHPVNQAFLRYASRVGIYDLDDIDELQNVIKLYDQLIPPEHYEFVEITEADESPKICTNLLGFDLVHLFHQSLLSSGMHFSEKHPRTTDLDKLAYPLLCLIESFFQPQLNNFGLFTTLHDAEFCLECMMAVQALRPNLWEAEEDRFRVVGIWTCMTDAEAYSGT